MKQFKQFIILLLVIALISTDSSTVALANCISSSNKAQNGASINSKDKKETDSDRSSLTDQSFSTEFKIKSKWSGGFKGKIILKNTGTTVIENWALKFDFEYEIDAISKAEIVEHTDGKYIIKNDTHNADIKPGCYVSIEFSALCTDAIKEPSNFAICSVRRTLDSDDFTVNYWVKSHKKKGFISEITITNNSEQPIEHWTLDFDFDNKLSCLSGTQLVSKVNNHYSLEHSNNNSVIEPGKTITIGITSFSSTIFDFTVHITDAN